VLRPASETERYAGRVITVASPKGGVGKTTVSTNLAIGLTAAAPQSTVLVDLDVQFGDVASALGLVPEYTLPDAVRGPASEDTMVLKTFLTQHPSGLYAVCGAESPAEGDTVSGDDVTRLLASLAREFRYVVVDTAPGLSEQTLAALDRASDVVMLTSMDVPGVRGLRKELDVLRELAMIPAGRHVVMNFADPKGGLSVRDVELAIGTGVDVVLPRTASVPASTNQGVPLLQSGRRRDPMVKELRRLVSRFSATPLKVARGRAKHRAAS
jgi:pilus assembly protein CpaE